MGKNIEEIKIKIYFYIISLWLLFLLIIVLTIDFSNICKITEGLSSFCIVLKQNVISLVSSVFFLISMCLCKKVKHKFKGTKQLPTKIIMIEDVDCEHLTFLTTYIIPLVCIPISQTRYFLVLIILMIVIGAISIKTNLFYANPTLALLGYHLYKIDTDDGLKSKIILSKDVLDTGSKIQYIKIDEKTYYARGATK